MGTDSSNNQEQKAESLCYGIKHRIAYIDTFDGQVVCNYSLIEKDKEGRNDKLEWK